MPSLMKTEKHINTKNPMEVTSPKKQKYQNTCTYVIFKHQKMFVVFHC